MVLWLHLVNSCLLEFPGQCHPTKSFIIENLRFVCYRYLEGLCVRSSRRTWLKCLQLTGLIHATQSLSLVAKTRRLRYLCPSVCLYFSLSLSLESWRWLLIYCSGYFNLPFVFCRFGICRTQGNLTPLCSPVQFGGRNIRYIPFYIGAV